jgi:hypothetical protein
MVTTTNMDDSCGFTSKTVLVRVGEGAHGPRQLEVGRVTRKDWLGRLSHPRLCHACALTSSDALHCLHCLSVVT